MAKIRLLAIGTVSVTAAFALFAISQELQLLPKAGQGQAEVDTAEINTLIAQLGHNAYETREKASKRLTEIGVLALDSLYDAEESDDAEIRNRATLIAKAIRAAHALPTRVNGLEFKLVTDRKVWIVPALGEDTRFSITLQITNTTNKRCWLALGNSQLIAASVGLRDRAGKSLGRHVGRERGMGAALFSPALEKNATHTIRFEAVLFWRDRELILGCEDAFSNCFEYRELSKGEYRLSAVYGNDRQFFETEPPFKVGLTSSSGTKEFQELWGYANEPFWVGFAETRAEAVTIK